MNYSKVASTPNSDKIEIKDIQNSPVFFNAKRYKAILNMDVYADASIIPAEATLDDGCFVRITSDTVKGKMITSIKAAMDDANFDSLYPSVEQRLEILTLYKMLNTVSTSYIDILFLESDKFKVAITAALKKKYSKMIHFDNLNYFGILSTSINPTTDDTSVSDVADSSPLMEIVYGNGNLDGFNGFIVQGKSFKILDSMTKPYITNDEYKMINGTFKDIVTIEQVSTFVAAEDGVVTKNSLIKHTLNKLAYDISETKETFLANADAADEDYQYKVKFLANLLPIAKIDKTEAEILGIVTKGVADGTKLTNLGGEIFYQNPNDATERKLIINVGDIAEDFKYLMFPLDSDNTEFIVLSNSVSKYAEVLAFNIMKSNDNLTKQYDNSVVDPSLVFDEWKILSNIVYNKTNRPNIDSYLRDTMLNGNFSGMDFSKIAISSNFAFEIYQSVHNFYTGKATNEPANILTIESIISDRLKAMISDGLFESKVETNVAVTEDSGFINIEVSVIDEDTNKEYKVVIELK